MVRIDEAQYSQLRSLMQEADANADEDGRRVIRLEIEEVPQFGLIRNSLAVTITTHAGPPASGRARTYLISDSGDILADHGLSD